MNRRPSTTSPAALAFQAIKAGKGKSPAKVAHTKAKVSRRATKALNDRANRALQDWYRAQYQPNLCEGMCGKDFEVMHHFIEKSQSIGLRFEHTNLIFLCHGCHYRHHRTGDQTIMQNVIMGRGMAWLKRIHKLKHERKRGPFSRSELEEIIAKYSLPQS